MVRSLALLWNSKQVTVYDGDTSSVHSAFNQSWPIIVAALLAHVDRCVVLVVNDKAHFTNLSGHVQKMLSVGEGVISLDVTARFFLPQSIKCAESGASCMPMTRVVPHMHFARQLGGMDSCRVDDSDALSRTALRVDTETTAALVDFPFAWRAETQEARAARACTELEENARLAIVAIHLNMGEDAYILLKTVIYFTNKNKATIGADFLTKEVTIDDKVVTLQI